MIYCMGTEAEQIYKLLSFKKEDEKYFNVILIKFDSHFMPKKMSSTSVLNFT